MQICSGKGFSSPCNTFPSPFFLKNKGRKRLNWDGKRVHLKCHRPIESAEGGNKRESEPWIKEINSKEERGGGGWTKHQHQHQQLPTNTKTIMLLVSLYFSRKNDLIDRDLSLSCVHAFMRLCGLWWKKKIPLGRESVSCFVTPSISGS
ncbi:hypothetical protein DL98DRAFT_182761 [Cadophora sp. DSE1049]|nr:hypothetical protein DL98DRAFT_182761 [Cadophora sp. DSE1049]